MPPSATLYTFLWLQVCHQHKSAQHITGIPIHNLVRRYSKLFANQVRND
jgi:hypothetical protein